MKVLCSGEIYTDPIEAEKCLECALYSGNPPCGYSYPLLKTMFAANLQEQRSEEVHVSDMLSCLRKVYLDKTDPQPQYVHLMLTLLIGTAIHEMVERTMYTDPVVESEMEVADENVQGRIDLYFKGVQRLTDIKTSRWINVSQLPHGNHAKQTNIYAALMEKMGIPVNEILIQYIDVSGPSKCKRCYSHPVMMMIGGVVQCPECGYMDEDAHLGAIQVPVEITDQVETLQDIEQRALRLKKAIEDKSMPEAETGWICRYCLQVDNCPEGQYFLSRKGRKK